MSKIDWNAENVATLLACTNDEELRAAFPEANLDTLKRKARSVRASDELLDPTPNLENVAGSIALTGDSGVINTGEVTEPISDWTNTLQVWGLDPDVFEVVEPVTMKAWDTGSGRKFSYCAKIQKKASAEPDIEDSLDIEGWRQNLQGLEFVPNSPRHSSGVSYLIMVADPQLGKPGTQEALNNWTSGLEGHVERVRNLIDSGYPINDVALAFMGDEHEGAVGNYASQPYEVELNYSDQITLDFDMRVWSIRQLLQFDLPISVASVPSNHGEHTRFGSNKALTSIYDNSSTMVTKLVQKVFNGPDSDHYITWDIASNRQDANLELNGIKINFTHGHVSNGTGSKTGGVSSKNAIEKQILGRTEELANTRLYVTAHYHHFNIIEDRGRTFFGCPALEAEKSSQWFYDSAGVWSKPGMLGFVVGNAAGSRGWDELAVI